MSKPPPSASAVLEVLPPVAPAPADLAASINAAYHTARTAAASATEQARAAIAAAIECGHLLQRQKASLPHGAWLPWLTTHCPELSAETARRYMRLAKRSHATDLTAASSLRQAYLATGVLPAPPVRAATPPDANAPVITFTRGLDQFRRWYHRRTEDLPLAKWSPEARRLLRQELTWFKNLHDTLAA